MSTHVDGAPPSVSPDPDDGEPHRPPSGLDDGSQWVRAEIQRRMAANRSTRGRHARRGGATATPSEGLPETAARESPRRDPLTPGRGSQSVPLPPPGFVAAGDLPENYVPRHSVQTPGPAAEPAAPITGPIPIVRPDGPESGGPLRAPVGGPSLPPTGMPLPVRKKRTGPGTPLSGGGPPTGPWSRPGASIVPSEPVQRLGAPPGMRGGADALPSWGVPASPPRGFPPATAEPADGRATDDDAAADEVSEPAEVAGIAADPTDTGPAADPGTHDPDTPDTRDAAARDAVGSDDDAPAATGSGVAVRPGAADIDLSEVTTASLPVVPGPTVDGAVAPPARLVGIPVQRASAPARNVAPRPVTPRNIPVVGTAPPEPGSTRVRVVLSERKGIARPVRTIKEVQEGTAVGELLRRDLIRSQLMVTLRFGSLAVLVLGVLPAILTLLPAVGQFDVLGLRVPWLLLGVLMYPFLVGVAWRYTRVADRVEQNFADHVQD